jgi:hypothetical protein
MGIIPILDNILKTCRTNSQIAGSDSALVADALSWEAGSAAIHAPRWLRIFAASGRASGQASSDAWGFEMTLVLRPIGIAE